MRDLITHNLLPHVATTSLLALIGLLTWLGWRSKRGSALHRLRLWALTALVAISGGAAVSCGDDSNAPGPNTGTDGTTSGQTDNGQPPDGPMMMCYEPAVEPPPGDAGPVPHPPPTCYMPVVPNQPPGGGGPQPSGDVNTPQPDGGPEQVTPRPPVRMCYAPRPGPPRDDSTK